MGPTVHARRASLVQTVRRGGRGGAARGGACRLRRGRKCPPRPLRVALTLRSAGDAAGLVVRRWYAGVAGRVSATLCTVDTRRTVLPRSFVPASLPPVGRRVRAAHPPALGAHTYT